MAASPTRRQPRRDAVRNRARLVEAAARAFRAHGLDVSVNDIARDAGVNIATLYRHFATKDELVEAVLETVLEPLQTARDRALRAPDGAVLATFAREVLRLQRRQRGLVDALRHHPPGAVRERLRDPAIDLVTPLVQRAHDDGELRPELDAVDLLILLRMLAVAAGPARAGGPDRYVDIILRGLRPG